MTDRTDDLRPLDEAEKAQLDPTLVELLEALDGRASVTVESLAPSIRAFLEALEKAEHEATTLKRLHQVAEVTLPDDLASLDRFLRIVGSADAVLKFSGRAKEAVRSVVSAIRTLDREQALLARDLRKPAGPLGGDG